MAKTVKINKNTYDSVPRIEIPKADGSGYANFYDTGDATATPENTSAGDIGYNANGRFVGTKTDVSVSQDPTTKVLTIS